MKIQRINEFSNDVVWLNHSHNNKQKKLWNAIENDEYKIYDQFVDFIKNFYAPSNNNLAYSIEDDVNNWMIKMTKDLDSKYGTK